MSLARAILKTAGDGCKVGIWRPIISRPPITDREEIVEVVRDAAGELGDTLAIGEYLNEIRPAALLLPEDRAKRTRCRSISAEMHSGFGPMRSALPMNLKGDFPNFKVWTRAQADIDRITGIWRECLGLYGGPFLLGDRSMADAMYAPVATRFLTYYVKLDKICGAYCRTIMAMPEMIATSRPVASRRSSLLPKR